MVREDILTALRNALERGEDIDSASKSMISGGYDKFEVFEATKVLINEQSNSQIPPGQTIQPQTPLQTSVQPPLIDISEPLPIVIQKPPSVINKQRKKGSKKLVLLIFIAFLLIVAVGLSYLLLTKFI